MAIKEICPDKDCTACMACVNVCPKSCISMKQGKLGHIYPVIDADLCIECGLCIKSCQVNYPLALKSPVTAYAGWHKDIAEYHTSTSGGAAAALSNAVIADGGVVYGCESRKGVKICHVRIDRQEELYRLKGSKYVQSYVGSSTMKDVRSDLNHGLKVLFIGTPCQVAGLKSFLKKDYENLLTVDIICHGVPAVSYLRRHVKRVSGGKGTSVTFRKGNDMALRVFDASGEKIYYSNVWRERFKDTYYNAFIDGYTYRDCCYTCKFARPERVSDITIGDFWGLGADLKHDSVNGCSCILPVTDKGHILLKGSEMELHERDVMEAVNGNGQLRAPSRLDLRRKIFRRLVPLFGEKFLYRICESDHIAGRFLQRVRRKLKL